MNKCIQSFIFLFVVSVLTTASAFGASTITASPAGPDFCYCKAVSVSFAGTPIEPTVLCCNKGTSVSWSLTNTAYVWSGDVMSPAPNGDSAALDTVTKKGDVSITCKATWTWTCSCDNSTTTTTDTATGNYKTRCLKETIVIVDSPQCGTDYGATVHYFYDCSNWWAKESVTNGSSACASGPITQVSNPVQMPSTAISDTILNHNGPPASVADCTDTTNQIIYVGPTQARVNDCTFNHTQVIVVKRTPGSSPATGTVTTSVGSESAKCNW